MAQPRISLIWCWDHDGHEQKDGQHDLHGQHGWHGQHDDNEKHHNHHGSGFGNTLAQVLAEQQLLIVCKQIVERHLEMQSKFLMMKCKFPACMFKVWTTIFLQSWCLPCCWQSCGWRLSGRHAQSCLSWSRTVFHHTNSGISIYMHLWEKSIGYICELDYCGIYVTAVLKDSPCILAWDILSSTGQ